jgi:hypothetical protein
MNPAQLDASSKASQGTAMRQTCAVSLHVIGAVGGGFACTTALVALAAVALPLITGMARSEAALLSAMLGFIVYLVLLLWAFAERRLWLVWAVFLGGGAAAFWIAQRLAPLLVAGTGG